MNKTHRPFNMIILISSCVLLMFFRASGDFAPTDLAGYSIQYSWAGGGTVSFDTDHAYFSNGNPPEPYTYEKLSPTEGLVINYDPDSPTIAWSHIQVTFTSATEGKAYDLDDQSPLGSFLAIPPSDLIFIKQPTNAYVYAGQTVVFRTMVAGIKPISFQWQKNGTNLINGGRISGATSTNLTIVSLQMTDAGTYSLVASNTSGTLASANAVLTVMPANQSFSLLDYYYPIHEGNEWIYDAEGNWDDSPNALWRVDTESLELTCYTGRNAIQSYMRDVVRLDASYGFYDGFGFSRTDEWYEYPIVLGGWGTAGYDDDPGTMEMRLDPALIITNRMTIGQSITRTVDAYVNATFTSQATYTLQLVERVSVTVPAGDYPDCLHLKYTLTLPGENQTNHEWWALGVGMVKKTVSVPGEPTRQYLLNTASFVSPPRVLVSPASSTNAPGSAASFNVLAIGDEPLTFQWRRNGTDLEDSDYISGATTTNLIITDLQYSDAGGYDVVVVNDYGSVTSAVAVLTVGSRPTTFNLMDYFHPMVAGNEWFWQGTDYDGNPTIRDFWVEDTAWPLIICTPTRTYTNTVARMYKAYLDPDTLFPMDTWYEYFNVAGNLGMWGMDDDPGEYEARIDGGLVFPTNMTIGQPVSVTRSIYTNCALETQWTMQFTILGLATITVPAGTFPDCLHLRMVITEGGRSQTSEQWCARGIGAVKQNEVPDLGEKRLELVSYNVVTVPQIISPPRSLTNSITATANLSVIATGTRPFSYQWRRNGLDLADDGRITGANSHQLTIADLQYADGGNYTVVVANDFGSVTSAPPALLTVNESIPPEINILSHADLQVLPSATIMLAGSASDAGRGDNGVASVTVNGLRATNDVAFGSATANWSWVVNLALGTNRIVVVAKDTRGNAATNVIRIIADTQKPTLTIQSPLNGQRILTNSGLVTVRGIAGDNRCLSGVLYSLNDGDWTDAATANGWSNWSVTVGMRLGTNTVRTYAEDCTGNVSTTNSVRFQYVVTTPMALEIVGKGTVTGLTNGQQLEVGRAYSFNASAGLGFALTNWTTEVDSVTVQSTNRAPIAFTMVSNLALRVTFADGQKPGLTITSPLSGARITNEQATVRGKVTDNGWVEEVRYRLNGADWQTASGTTNWQADITLQPGTNWFEAFALDRDGLRSTTNRAAYFRVVTNLMTVTKVGKGTITPDYNGKWLEIGRGYSMMATPSLGFVLTNWTDEADQVVTNKASVSFLMRTNLALRANFVDGQKPAITIAAPLSGARVLTNNGLVTVRGTTSDNWAVTNVLCAVNDGDWTSATTTNNWTNWSITASMRVGTNVARVFAQDKGGNVSATNSVRFQYVVTQPVCLQVAGKGSVTGLTNTQQLEIGRAYSFNPVAALGYVLTNWTVTVDGAPINSTNRAPIQFVMQSNLCVQVTFADTAKPTLTVTAPTTGQRWSNAVFKVAGRVADNGPVSAVWYQLNTNDWATAATTNNWTNWTAMVELLPGTNVLTAYAVDAGGNRSTTNTARCTYVVSDLLKLATVGKGSLSPNYSNAVLEVNRTYTITATAALGYGFTNWTAKVGDAILLSTNKAGLNFLMQSNLSLTATFVDVAKPVITIVTPAPGQRVSNELFTVTGKVTDNGPVAEVKYQLNGRSWADAQTANAWSNWTASITLPPGTNTLRAYAVDTAGNRSQTNVISFTLYPPSFLIASSSGNEVGLSVAFNGSNFLAAIEGDVSSGKNITAQLVSPAGTLPRARTGTGRTGRDAIPLVASANNVFLLVWNDDASGGRQPYGQLIDNSGNTIGASFAIATTPSFNNNLGELSVEVASDGQDFLVVWADDRGGIWGRVVPSDDPTSGSEKQITAEYAKHPAVASAGTNYLVVWEEGLGGDPWDVYGTFVNADGDPIGTPFEISQNTSGKRNPLTVGFDGSDYLVIWNWQPIAGATGTWDILARFVHPDPDNPLPAEPKYDHEFVIANAPGSQAIPRVAFGQGHYLILWDDGMFNGTGTYTVKGRFFDTDGNSVGSEFTPFTTVVGKQPIIAGAAFDGTRFLIIGTLGTFTMSSTPFSSCDIYGAFIAPPPSAASGSSLNLMSQNQNSTMSLQSQSVPSLQFERGPGGLQLVNGAMQMRLAGPAGTVIVVERSADLKKWKPLQTNAVPVEGLNLSVPIDPKQPAEFFRVRRP